MCTFIYHTVQDPPLRELLLTIEVLIEVPLEILRRVIESEFLVHLINLLDLLLLQLEIAFEVGFDSALGLAFRQNSPPGCIRQFSISLRAMLAAIAVKEQLLTLSKYPRPELLALLICHTSCRSPPGLAHPLSCSSSGPCRRSGSGCRMENTA